MGLGVDSARDEAGRFVPGVSSSPGTQFRPGERRSPRTEFKPGGDARGAATRFAAGGQAHNKLPIGAESVRTETTTGSPRAWVKIAEPNVWQKRAIVVWERANGRRLAHGSVVHHKDRNPLNDDPDNLVALTRRQHADEHRDELDAARERARSR